MCGATRSSWPPQRGVPTTYFADAGGRLGTTRPAAAGRDDYRVDPAVGLHLLPWDPQAPVTPMPYDRAEDDHRSLCYDTEPLPADLEIVGSPEAVISLTADQPDFPLHVALCDVAPNGHSTLICQGWGSAARLAGQELQPGESYDLEVPLYATSSRVPPATACAWSSPVPTSRSSGQRRATRPLRWRGDRSGAR